MALYRVYRPKDFPSLVGQEHVRTTLLNAIKNQKLAHAYLFTGPRGTGKTTVARLLAKALNSDKMTADGRFDDCELAAEIDQGKLIDVLEIDAASNRGIDEIRDLREKINFAPTRARNKVYIIDEVHMLTKEAFNALLKTLEEPPTFVYFILATTEIQKVPETIISRCQRFDFKRIADGDIAKRLQEVCVLENFEYEEAALELIAKQARGGLRDALTLLEQAAANAKVLLVETQKLLGIATKSMAQSLFTALQQKDTQAAITLVGQAYDQGLDLNLVIKDFLNFLREELLNAVKANLVDQADWLMSVIENFQVAAERQKNSYIPQLPCEIAIIKSTLDQKKNLIATPPAKSQIVDSQVLASVNANAVIAKEKVEVNNASAMVADATTLSSTESAKNVSENTVEVSLASFLENWQVLGERVHNSTLKRSLGAAKPIKFSGNSLTLGFQNNFYKDKLLEPELLAELERELANLTGQNIKIEGQIMEEAQANLQPAASSDPMAILGDLLS